MFSVAIKLGAPNNVRHYLPLSVRPQLRGYTGEGSQVRADMSKGKLVSITALAISRCPTGRDLFLEHQSKVETVSWERMVLGRVVDSLLAELHQRGLDHMEDAFEESLAQKTPVDLRHLRERVLTSGEEIIKKKLTEWVYKGKDPRFKDLSIEQFADQIDINGRLVDKTTEALSDLVKYETNCLINFLQHRRRISMLTGFWSKRRYQWMAEAKATLARLQAEVALDKSEQETRQFGVSTNIKPDFLYAVTLIGDIKTGKYQELYEKVATGYAIFAEYRYQRRFNTAAILAVDLDLHNGRLRSHEVKIIRPTDQDRQIWVTRRDLALQVIRSATAPPHPNLLDVCPECPYLTSCWNGGKPGVNPTTPLTPAKGTPQSHPASPTGGQPQPAPPLGNTQPQSSSPLGDTQP